MMQGVGNYILHKPVGDQLILKITSVLHFFPAHDLFTFPKVGKMGSRFRWFYRLSSLQMEDGQLSLPQPCFDHSLDREFCPMFVFCTGAVMLAISLFLKFSEIIIKF